MDKLSDWVARLLIIAWVLMLAWLMSGCRTQYVPVESVRTDSIFLSKTLRDSIYVKDSVWVKEVGDTIWVDKYRYVYKYVSLHDTIYIERRDSVQVPYPVERKLTFWEKIKIDVGNTCSLIIFAIIIYFFMRLMVRKKQKE